MEDTIRQALSNSESLSALGHYVVNFADQLTRVQKDLEECRTLRQSVTQASEDSIRRLQAENAALRARLEGVGRLVEAKVHDEGPARLEEAKRFLASQSTTPEGGQSMRW